MNPKSDSLIWNKVIKAQTNNMTDSIAKCDIIIKALGELQKAVKVCSDELEQQIALLDKTVKASNENLKRKLVDLEKKMKAIGCVNNGAELLRAIFTLGLACLFDNDTKKEMRNVKADLLEEQTIMNAIAKRMDYFDDLLGAAKTVVKEAAGVVNTTKTFRQALVLAKKILEKDYTQEDIEENLGDVDFANDFSDELMKTLQDLRKVSVATSQDCSERQHRLTAALTGINKDF